MRLVWVSSHFVLCRFALLLTYEVGRHCERVVKVVSLPGCLGGEEERFTRDADFVILLLFGSKNW